MNNLSTANNEELARDLLVIVNQLVSEVHPSTFQHLRINIDSSFDRDLGLDSLTRVELLARVEKGFGVTLPERVLSSVETPRELVQAVMAAGPDQQASVTAPAPVSSQPDTGTVTTPDTAATLVEVLQYHAGNHPDRIHIRLFSDSGEDETITYGELLTEASGLAKGLQSHGLAAGESVLLMLPIGRDYFISFFGTLLAGGVPVPVYPPGRIKQLEEHLKRHAAIAANCGAPIMITMPEAKTFTRLMHQKVMTLKTLATVNEIREKGLEHPLHIPQRNKADTAFLQYTSGSTGMPKGVVLSNGNLLANVRAMGRAVKVSSEDVFVSWLPLYHDMGLIGAWLGSLYFACPLVIMSPLTFLSRPIRWLKAISRYRGTLAAAPNFAYELCLRRIDDEELADINLSSWRCAFNGAEAVSPTTMENFCARFAAYGLKPETMMPVYGLAESSVGLAFPPLGRGVNIDHIDRPNLMQKGLARPVPPGNPDALSLPGCGFPLPGHQIRVVDDNDRELPDRTQGHVQFQGPSTTTGYFRNPDQTHALFHGAWLDSGDLGYLAGGELFVTGRSKDMIIKGGRNIYPVELEEAISDIEGVRKGNVAVFGSVDLKSGTEKLVVMAETRKRKPEDLERIRGEVNSLVSDITGTAPDEVVLAPPNTVLKTSSGKIRRRASCELYEKGLVGKGYRPLWLQLTSFALTSTGSVLRNGWQNLVATRYATYCWLLFLAAAPFSILGVTLLPTMNLRWRFNRFLVRLVFRMASMPIRVEGLENLPPARTPCIVVANHASYLDSIILAGVLPRPFGFIAKAELKNNLLLRFLLPRIGTEFVERFDRAKGVEDSQKLTELVKDGRSLAFFPEGTFMRMAGLLPFRLGAFETAVKGNLPVVPLAIRGSRSLLRAESWFPRRSNIKVTLGIPVAPEKNDDAWHSTVQLRDKVREQILQMCGEPDLAYERPPILSGEKPEQ